MSREIKLQLTALHPAQLRVIQEGRRFNVVCCGRRWGKTVDSGWSDWDVEVHYHPWTMLQVCSAQEDHADGKRLIRVRYRLRPTPLAQLAAWAARLPR